MCRESDPFETHKPSCIPSDSILPVQRFLHAIRSRLKHYLDEP